MLRTTASVVFCALFFAVFIALEGCGSDPWDIPCTPTAPCEEGYACWRNECWPACDAQTPCPKIDNDGNPSNVVCHEGYCYRPNDLPDAGTTDAGDAGDAGDGGKTSAICGEPCTPLPDGWSPMPAFWIGATKELPAYAPDELGGWRARPVFNGRADLDAPPAECDVCSCGESSGKCTALPSSIDVRASMCGEESSSLSFGGPTNWDGSCTNVNAIPAGAKCPDGSSTLCAQSVAVAPLGAPVDESCTPFTDESPVPKLHTSYGPFWKTYAVGYDVPGCNAGESCLPSVNGLPKDFRSCIYKRGKHECPADWSGARRVVYEVSAGKPGYVDDRNCSPCACGVPVDSLCVGQFRVFEDAACTKQIWADPITSIKGQCTDVLPPGKALGSKEFVGLAYLPGTCEVLGGKPIGAAIPDAEQAVTVCCPGQDA